MLVLWGLSVVVWGVGVGWFYGGWSRKRHLQERSNSLHVTGGPVSRPALPWAVTCSPARARAREFEARPPAGVIWAGAIASTAPLWAGHHGPDLDRPGSPKRRAMRFLAWRACVWPGPRVIRGHALDGGLDVAVRILPLCGVCLPPCRGFQCPDKGGRTPRHRASWLDPHRVLRPTQRCPFCRVSGGSAVDSRPVRELGEARRWALRRALRPACVLGNYPRAHFQPFPDCLSGPAADRAAAVRAAAACSPAGRPPPDFHLPSASRLVCPEAARNCVGLPGWPASCTSLARLGLGRPFHRELRAEHRNQLDAGPS